MTRLFLLLLMAGASVLVRAQDGLIADDGKPANWTPPNDGAYQREIHQERKPLAYPQIREADIFWEKRIWRVLDLREKMNKHFTNPQMPFVSILQKAWSERKMAVYADEGFTQPMTRKECSNLWQKTDTVLVIDPLTGEETITVVRNDFNPDNVKRFRIKESWFFDTRTSTLQVRILGIAPLMEKMDELGNPLYETPMFWIYYPDLRNTLAKYDAVNNVSDASRLSWDDIMEMRFFSSYIVKSSNVDDRRIKDMFPNDPMAQLIEADKIHQEIFNMEQDMWVK